MNPRISIDELVSELKILPPTDEQAEIAAYPPFTQVDGRKKPNPLLVVAGAGSGKTETLSLRATYIAAAYGVPAENILGLTFTRKAAAELEQRLRRRLQQWRGIELADQPAVLVGSPEATTYNGFAVSVVREFGALVGIDPQIGHLGSAAAWQMMNEIVLGWSGELPENASGTVVGRALGLRGAILDQGMSLNQAGARLTGLLDRFEEAEAAGRRCWINFHRNGKKAVEGRLQLLDVIAAFDQRMRADGLMDFSEQVRAATKIVEESSEAREVLRERHQVVFLDEFQDTSVSQLRFLSALFANHPVTAVGDPNQAIYGWRGASAASLDDFHSLFNTDPETDNKTLTLSTAWRNDRLILDVANRISSPLAKPPSWHLDSHVAGTGKKDLEGQVVFPILRARKDAQQGVVASTYRQFEQQSIDDVVDFIGSVRAESGGTATSVVLSRKVRTLLPVVGALREAGIPAQLASGEALLGHPAVIDLRAALQVTTDIGRSDALARLLTNLDLGAADLRALSDFSWKLTNGARQKEIDRQILILDGVTAIGAGMKPEGLTEVARIRIKGLSERLEILRARRDRSISEQISTARTVLALDIDALADPLSVGVSEVLDQFAQIAADYESSVERPTMAAFLAWLEVAESEERGIKMPSAQFDPNAVQVMTVHAAKGLEWDAVAVIDLTNGGFPSYGSGGGKKPKEVFAPEAPAERNKVSGWWTDLRELPYDTREDRVHLPTPNYLDMSVKAGSSLETAFKEDMGEYALREERRLAYVAFTRAKKWLFLTGAWNRGAKSVYFPSTFITEASGVEGVTADLSSSPSAEQIEDSRARGVAQAFPRKPSENRRAAEQMAVQVLETLRDLAPTQQSLSSGTRERVLSSLEDRQLADAISKLLAERDRLSEQAKQTGSDPESVLRSVASVRDLAVTEIARFRSDPQSTALELRRPIPSVPGDRGLVGTAFHKWVELHFRQLGAESVGQAEPELLDFDGTLQEGSLGDGVIAALNEQDREQFEKLRAAFLGDNSFADHKVVALEAPFWIPTGDLPVRGRIDAVFKDPGGDYLLVDWKTKGSLSSSIAPETARYYRTQLGYYVAAWAPRAAEEGAAVNAQIVFVTPDGLKRVTVEELEEIGEGVETQR